MKIIYFFMQEHLGKIYVPICEYKVCVFNRFSDHENLGFFNKVLFFDMYQATYGYLAKFTLPISQVYFHKLQSSPCYCATWLLCQVEFIFLPSPLPNGEVNFVT